MKVLEKFSLKGKTALITGGTSGLGKEMAKSLLEAGAEVAIIGKDEEKGVKVKQELIEKTGQKTIYIKGDVRKSEDIENFVKLTIENFGKIDILITSAGINIRKNAEDLTIEEVRDLFDTNFFGTWYTCKIVGKHMIERRYGRIITIGSILSFVTIPGRSIYSSTKGAIIQLTKTLAVEWAKYNITVNCICPGVFNTPINEIIFKDPEIKKSFLEKIPVGRIGNPEEIGPLAVFLSSDACPFITGSAILIDGGWTCL
ncbi:MAG: glucose 1-dehydrogenase [Candidatus Omnitrophica bacterium]|nr:glucose 1-dehydrogenase [Candidatus Omnitrophota bacterium]MCM8810112.1 glucose 1-dehydrogenase [Candidatus Omnitrophota bacterium]